MIDIESKIISYREDTNDYRLCLTREEIDKIKQALIKQEPMKRKFWKSGHSCCGNCERGILKEDKYCSYCGQRIWWSE